jgi:hypothetical protein
MMLPRLAACAGLLAAVTLAVPVAAQPKGGGTTEAVTLAREAKEKYDQGKWAEALALFQKAEDSAHSPVLLLYAARCHRNLGQLVRARELYLRVGSETLAANAPEPFRAAQRDAKSDLDVLEPRIPRLVIDRSRAPASWTLELDGAPIASATEPVLVDPGSHVLVAKDGTTETFKQNVDAREGERVPVKVEPTPKESTQPETPTPRKTDINPAETPDSSPSAVSYVPGAILLTLGVGGLAAGVATRVMAFDKVEDVKSRCSGNRCLASDREEIESADTLQTVSTIAFAAGGAVAATGIILLIVLPMQDEKPAVSIRIDPTGAMLTGSF